MNQRHRAFFLAPAALAVTLSSSAARAAELDCAALAIEADAAIRGTWPDLVSRLRDELSARPGIDVCAQVALRLQRTGVIDVSVALPDGRIAARSVLRSEDVVPTLQALLLVPEPAPTVEPAPRAAPPTAAKRRAPRVDRAGHAERALVLPRTEAARQVGVELSLLTGARIGGGQVALGAGVLSFLEVKSWLIGFQGRADRYQPIQSGDAEVALELAILGGKRFELGNVALDLSAGPAIAMKGFALGQSDTEVVHADGGALPPVAPPPSDPTTGPVPRFIAGARLGFRPRSVFRTFVGLDAELGPSRASDDSDPNSSRLPVFSLGLAVGATVGTP